MSKKKEERLAEAENFNKITNEDFIETMIESLPEAHPAICMKKGDPEHGGWVATNYDVYDLDWIPQDTNNYLNCSSFFSAEDGGFNVKKENFAAYHFIMLDDVGSKIPFSRLDGLEPTWVIETSPGNFQMVFVLADPLTNIEEADRLIKSVIDARLSDKGAGGVSRWARLPNAINGKEKYRIDGQPFQCKLVEWFPYRRYTVAQLIDFFQLDLANEKPTTPPANRTVLPKSEDRVDPIIQKLKERGLYKREKESGIHEITCPWVHEHTDSVDNGTAYFEPTDEYPTGGFKCHHSHDYNINDLHRELGIEGSGKPIIKIEPGKMDQILDDTEKILSGLPNIFYYGGLMGQIATSQSGEMAFVPFKIADLTLLLAQKICWLKYKKDTEWSPSDPPERHVRMLFDRSGNSQYIPELKGIVRQPYFRDSDGVLVTEPGYDPISKLYGTFNPDEFKHREPTREVAEESLAELRKLLVEFRFVNCKDDAIPLVAMFTAVIRATIDLAPGFHVHAATIGSGKSYLCRLISLFASAADSERTSYPKNEEDASKKILSLLMKSPACIEFDDMSSNWKPYTILKQMFTAETVTDRLLGVNKVATVSTRSLILGSGNNVEPERDMRRRVLTMYLDPQVETPSSLSYQRDPVAIVKSNRGKYAMAVINIIEAYRVAGEPVNELTDIASYGGDWTRYCRQPLTWLGVGDPVESLIEQVNHDPDKEALGEFLRAWFETFGATATPVRKAVESIQQYPYDNQEKSENLREAIYDLPVIERGNINNNKLGWFLKKNENKIVGGLKFVKTRADGRVAWMVVEIDPHNSSQK